MRKIPAAIALALVFAMPSFAMVHIGSHVGYTYSSMAELNRSWEKVKYDSEHNSISPTAASLSQYGSGIGLNLDLTLGEFIESGFRLGFQYVFPAKYTGLKEVVPGLFIPIETSTDALLIPIMFGVGVNLDLGLPFILTGYAFGGWAVSYAFENTRYAGSVPYLTTYSGGGLIGELTAAIEFKALEFLTFSVNTGYRWAKISGMKAIQGINVDIPGYGNIKIDSSDPLATASGKELAVDFSGISVGLGVNIRF